MSRRVLLVLTSHDDLGGLRPTGFYVGEAADPWKVFTDAGYRVDIASIKGGAPPEDRRKESDPIQRAFLADPEVAAQLRDSPRLEDLDAAEYDAVLFVGGNGAMWDFPTSPAVDGFSRRLYENGGVVSAVCHGPAALTNVRLSDGTLLVAGRRVAGFTNAEEAAVGLTEVVPFLLSDRLGELGAQMHAAPDFTAHTVVDGRLITGQNPQSATGVAHAVVSVLDA